MGAGKTTVGKQLAEKLDRPFVDLDSVIEKKAALPIPLIFEQYGEHYFRQLESDMLQQVAHSPGKIIATGGGIILNDENRNLMRNKGVTVYLKWESNILHQRIKNSTHRPLIKSINENELAKRIELMLKYRLPFYEQADLTIDGDDSTTPDEIVELIIQKLPSTIIAIEQKPYESYKCKFSE